MKKRYTAFCIAALLAFGACATDELPTPSEPQPGTPEQNEPVSGEVLVKFQSYVSDMLDQMEARTRSGAPATCSGILSVDEVLDLIGGYEIERIFPVDARTEERTREAGLNLWYVVRFNKEYSVEEVIARLSQLGEVQYANPNRKIQRAYSSERKATPLTRETLEMLKRRTSRHACRSLLQRPAASDAVESGQRRHDVHRHGGLPAGEIDRRRRRSVPGGLERLDGRSVDHRRRAGRGCLPDTPPSWPRTSGPTKMKSTVRKKDNDGNGYAGDIHGYNFVTNTGIITWDDLNDTGHGTHKSPASLPP